MENVKKVAKQLGVLPKLQLGVKLEKGGAKSTGAHRVKFVAEPTLVPGKDDTGKPRQELKFTVEENGIQYRWHVPVLNKQGQPNYLIERTMNIEVGDERILEMRSDRGRNYIDIRGVDEAPNEAPDEDDEPGHGE